MSNLSNIQTCTMDQTKKLKEFLTNDQHYDNIFFQAKKIFFWIQQRSVSPEFMCYSSTLSMALQESNDYVKACFSGANFGTHMPLIVQLYQIAVTTM